MPVIRPKFSETQKRSFSQSILLLMSGTIITQAITIVASPFLSRVFDAPAFGMAGLISTVASSMGWAGGFRYESAIVLAKRQKTADVLAAIVIQVSLAVAGLALVLALSYNPTINRWLGTEVLGSWLCLAPVWFFLTAFSLSHRMLAIRENNFANVNLSQLYQTITTVVLQFISGLLLSNSGISLVMSTLSGMVVAAAVLWIGNKRRHSREAVNGARRRKLVWAVLYKFRTFPLYKLPYTLVGTISPSLLIFVLSSNFGLQTAGFFFLSRRITSIPETIVFGSLNQVFFRKAVLELATPALSSTIHRIHRLIILLLFTPALLLMGILPELFQFVFGPQWEFAGRITSWYLFYSFAQLLTSWLDRLYDVTGKQKVALKLQIVSEILALFMIFGGVILKVDAITIIGAYSLCVFTYNLFGIYINFTINHVSLNGLWLNLGLLALTIIGCLSINASMQRIGLPVWGVLLADGLFFGLILFLNRNMLCELAQSLRDRQPRDL